MAQWSIPTELLTFPQPETKVFLNYIFPDKGRIEIWDKVKIVDFEPKKPEDCPPWQDVLVGDVYDPCLHPVALFNDPFRKGKNKIVLCVSQSSDHQSTVNTRAPCEKLLNDLRSEDPWFGLEQEYFITNFDGIPLGIYPNSLEKQKIGLQRQLAQTHLEACIYAGLKVAGMKRANAPGQWQYQIAPCHGTEAADHLIVSRFILMRLAELFNIEVSFKISRGLTGVRIEPSRLRINFSTTNMRQEGDGLKYIRDAVEKLKAIQQNSLDNPLTYYDLSSGQDVGNFGTQASEGYIGLFSAFMFPQQVLEKKCGYFQERRPCSNADPYAAITALTNAIFSSKMQ